MLLQRKFNQMNTINVFSPPKKWVIFLLCLQLKYLLGACAINVNAKVNQDAKFYLSVCHLHILNGFIRIVPTILNVIYLLLVDFCLVTTIDLATSEQFHSIVVPVKCRKQKRLFIYFSACFICWFSNVRIVCIAIGISIVLNLHRLVNQKCICATFLV